MRICSCCKEEKPDELFYKHPLIKPNGIRAKCNDCRNVYRKKAHKANPEIKRRQANDWIAANREHNAVDQKKRRVANPKRYKGYALKKAFGIGIDEYDSILAKQNGVCAICEQKETAMLKGKLKSLSVDHNHKTGKIRGLLCWHCNTAIGKFKDNIELLIKAIEYLKKHN